MNICIVSQQANRIISGIGLHTKNLIYALNRDGHNVYLIVPESERPCWHNPDKVLITPDPFWRANHARWIPLSWYFNQIIEQIREKYSFDLIHFTDAREALFTTSKVPLVGNINDTYAANLRTISYYKENYQDYLKRWIYYWVVRNAERLTYPRFDALLANSQYTADTISSLYPIRNERLHVCYKSISMDRFTTVKKGIKGSRVNRILFVGTNMQRKGLGNLLLAASKIVDKHPYVEYWVVGEDPQIKYYENLSVTLGVGKNFKFLGWKSQDELKMIFEAADVFVMPSLDEAFGVVLLEAMAAGLVVVGSNVGGIPELILHNQNGLLVEPNKPDQLADALDMLICNPSRMELLVKNGYETARKFNVDSMMQCTYRVYSQILSTRK